MCGSFDVRLRDGLLEDAWSCCLDLYGGVVVRMCDGCKWGVMMLVIREVDGFNCAEGGKVRRLFFFCCRCIPGRKLTV